MTDILKREDIIAEFEQIQTEAKISYRDPLVEPFGERKRMTGTQEKARDFLFKYTGEGPKVGMIAAKGASKTHWGAFFANHQSQRYPGSMGCVISNSYSQALDNAGPILIRVTEQLGYSIEFYQKKKIRGRQYTNAFVITLAPGIESFVLVRSFDNVSLLEGVELDWVWAEEIQDAGKDNLITVLSRNRGQGADNAVFLAGMPEDDTHWQYKFLPQIGIVPEEDYSGPTIRELPDGSAVTTNGIMYEASVFDNKHNVGADYIQGLLDMYDKKGADRYVYGKRTKSGGNRVLYSYNDDEHRKGIMSRLSCRYDPHRKLVFVFDFNVYPMSCAVFQPKPWNDDWDKLVWFDGKIVDPVTMKPLDPGALSAPNREIFAQVDELEVWPDDSSGGMTRGMAARIAEKYEKHPTSTVFVGDASGNRRETSASSTDWQLIAEAVKKFVEPSVIRGLVSNFGSDFTTTYSNPPNRDAWNAANAALKDGSGKIHVCMLPNSKLASGGLAAAVSAAAFGPDGKLDSKHERKKDRDTVRTHFADIFKYGMWYWRPPTAGGIGDSDAGTGPDDEDDDGWATALY